MKIKSELLFESHLTAENQLIDFVSEIKPYLGDFSLLLLSGDLAAGKTTFTRYLCELYDLKSIQSPTYAIHQRYKNGFIVIDHFDLYRMQSEDDLISTGFWDLLREEKTLVIVEWFEKIKDNTWLEAESQKRNIFAVKIEILDDNRNFKFFKLS